jgi:PAS domain S-box-containing protein
MKNLDIVLKNIVERLPYYIFWKDITSAYMGCNQRFLDLVGKQNADEIIGQTDFELGWGDGEPEFFRMADKRVMDGFAQINLEEILVRPDGSQIVMLVSKVPLRDEYHNCIGILGMSTDITEQKNMEELKKEKEIAEKSVEMMNLLTGSVAHELRNPLAAISMSLDLLKLSGHLEELKKPSKDFFLKYIENSQKAVKDAAHMMNMLLVKLRNLSKGEINTESFYRCNLIEDIEEAIQDYPFIMEEERALIRLAEYSSDMIYKGDKVLTKHVFYNLIKNALKVIKEIGKGDISISFSKNKTAYEVRFKDTAKGIPEKYLAKMFQKFETTDHTNSGAGLGLAFCKMVMETYGGSISCQSIEGEYTEFTLLFPKMK